MQTRQEIEVKLILPSIRRQLSVELKTLGIRQAEIARRLKLTKAAVTQYVKGIRGSNITLDEQTKEDIKNAAKNISEQKPAAEEIQKILQSLKDRKVTCKYHRLHNSEVDTRCTFCFK